MTTATMTKTTFTPSDLSRDAKGEIRNSETNRKKVSTWKVEDSGISGFGSNALYYTDYRIDDYIVRMTRESIQIVAVRCADGTYQSA